MTAHQRTEITIETDQVLVIRRPRLRRAWCRECGHEVDFVGLEEAGALSGMSQNVPDPFGSREWHVWEGPDGTPFICVESVLKSM